MTHYLFIYSGSGSNYNLGIAPQGIATETYLAHNATPIFPKHGDLANIVRCTPMSGYNRAVYLLTMS